MYWAVQWSWFARVNALCNVLRKKSREVAASLPGWFLRRCCFRLCITMEVETRNVKQYKCHHCCGCKNYWGKGMEGGKITSSWKFFVLGHPTARTSYCLLPDTFWRQASKNVFKVGSVKVANSLHCLPLWRKYAPEVKAAKGLKRCRAKSQGS